MSQRIDRINELLKREVSSYIQREFEFPGKLITVSAVEVTHDLREAKVFVSVLGGHPGPVLTKLNSKRGSIQNTVMKRVVLRCTPRLDFRVDNSAERGVEVVSLLDEVDQLPKAPEEDLTGEEANDQI